MENLEAIEFVKAEEIPLSDLKVGEWAIWETQGYHSSQPQIAGVYHRITPVFIQDLSARFMAQLIQPSMHYETTCLTEYMNWEAPGGRKLASKFFRTPTQPTFSRDHYLKVLKTLIWSNLVNYSGTDPEFFVEDAHGAIVPAFSFLKSKEKDPFCFWDGFQAEVTLAPSTCQDYLGSNIYAALRALNGRLPKGCRISPRSVIEVPEDILASAKEEHLAFGCRPSLNAYGMSGEVVPDPRNLNLRFAGGHIHWSINSEFRSRPDFEARVADAIKFVDLIAGLISVSISEGRDDPRRRRYYGLAGEYRLPLHGVEYRTLSNSWMVSPAVYHLIFTLGRAAMRLGLLGLRTRFQTVPERAVVEAINQSDPLMARELIQAESELFKTLIQANWTSPQSAKITFDRILQPMDSWGMHLEDMRANWDIKYDGRRDDASFRQRWGTFLETEKVRLAKEGTVGATQKS